MVVGPICLKLVAVRNQFVSQGASVRDHLLGVGLPGRLAGLKQGGSDTSDCLEKKFLSDNSVMKRKGRTLLWGPPWHAGNTASFTRFSRSGACWESFLKKIKPARGPRRVLWLRFDQIPVIILR